MERAAEEISMQRCGVDGCHRSVMFAGLCQRCWTAWKGATTPTDEAIELATELEIPLGIDLDDGAVLLGIRGGEQWRITDADGWRRVGQDNQLTG